MTHPTAPLRPLLLRRPVLALAAALALGGCAEESRVLPTTARFPLPAAAAGARTLGVDGAGRLWLGTDAALVAIDPAGRETARVTVPGAARVIAGRDGALLARRSGGGLLRIDGDSVRARPEERVRPAAPDPRGRWIYAAKVNGGVLGLDPATLAPAWGWPETGDAATALAVSPLGDRVYLATFGEADGALLRVLDAQTGRELSRTAFDAPVTALAAGRGDELLAIVGGGAEGLRHGADGVDVRWRAAPSALDLGGDDRAPELRVSPDGGRLAVFRAGGGLRVLAAEDGRVLGRTDEAPADAAWGSDGRLYVLEAGGVRVLR